MRASFKTLLLFTIALPVRLAQGDPVEIYVYPDSIREDLEGMVRYLEQKDKVTLDFYESQESDKSFSIETSLVALSSAAFPSSLGALKVINIEVNVNLYGNSDFYISMLLEFVKFLIHKGYRVYLHHLNNYIFADESTLQLGQHDLDYYQHTDKEERELSDMQMVWLAVNILEDNGINTLMLNKSKIRISPRQKDLLFRAVGY